LWQALYDEGPQGRRATNPAGNAATRQGPDCVFSSTRPMGRRSRRPCRRATLSPMDPFRRRPLLDALNAKKIAAKSWNSTPRLALAGSMRMDSRPSIQLAGYRSMIEGPHIMAAPMPMMMTRSRQPALPAKVFTMCRCLPAQPSQPAPPLAVVTATGRAPPPPRTVASSRAKVHRVRRRVQAAETACEIAKPDVAENIMPSKPNHASPAQPANHRPSRRRLIPSCAAPCSSPKPCEGPIKPSSVIAICRQPQGVTAPI